MARDAGAGVFSSSLFANFGDGRSVGAPARTPAPPTVAPPAIAPPAIAPPTPRPRPAEQQEQPAPPPALTELERVQIAADTARRALTQRDAAILDAFTAGYIGAEVAKAAGMSPAGVHRVAQRLRGEAPPSRRRTATDD